MENCPICPLIISEPVVCDVHGGFWLMIRPIDYTEASACLVNLF